MIVRLTVCFLSLVLGLRGAAEPLTVNSAYALALERSETLQIGAAEWRAAEARYRSLLGSRWPEVRVAAEAGFRERSDTREGEVYGAGAGASWTLFEGFRTLHRAEARQAEGEAIRFETARARQVLYLDVADSVFEILARDGELAAMQNQQAAYSERIAELEKRLALGRSRRAELLAARTQAEELRVDIEQARRLQAAARELLAFLTGLPAASITLAPPGALPAPEDVAVVLAAEDDRPDLRAAALQAEAARRELAAVRAERGVRVTADGNWYVWRDPDDEARWELGVKAELPLFDRGARAANVAAQVEVARSRVLRLSELRRTADRDVRLALNDVRGGLAQWSAMQGALKAGAENLEQQKREYELGRGGNLEVLQALVQWHGLRRRDAALTMQVHAALVGLQVAVGSGVP